MSDEEIFRLVKLELEEEKERLKRQLTKIVAEIMPVISQN